MQISLDWISDFVDLSDIDHATIAERLTLATAEVEGVEVLKRHVAGVLVGEIVSVEPLSDGKRTLVTVDCGARKYETVCGAPNARVGLKAPFAPPGTILAEGMRIESSEVAGHKSEGILCSARELGMSRWHEILLECPAAIENGTPLAEFVPEGDILIEIDNKSLTHRPDLWGHYAFARELAAVFERPLAPLPLSDVSRYDDLPAYPLSVEDLDGCPCYACLEFDVRAAQPSPLVVQRRLHALGQRTFNLMVDLTNYCMLELGQPTHAFDAARLNAVRVAPMGREGTFTTLDGQERRMLADDLLIWNEKEPVALAGVMGGLNSEVEDGTERVLLESANFQAARIRRTSVRLDLRTDSAQRFEKGQPPVNAKLGIQRILQLVEDAGAEPRATSRLTIAGDLKDEIRTIRLAPGRLAAMAGCRLGDEEIVKILDSLGFRAEADGDGQLTVGVPPFRSAKDISIEADIAEEVLRVYGYGRIEPKMPSFPLRPLWVNTELRIQHKLRRVLATSHRFLEVQNYGWTDDAWLAKLGFVPEKAIGLKNPATKQASRLRTTMVPNLLALVGVNRAHRDAFRLFEVGEVYSLSDGGGCDERSRLAGISYQQVNQPPLEDHFRQIKGAIEDLGRILAGKPLAFVPAGDGPMPWQTADHWVRVERGGHAVGSLGVLDAKLLDVVAPDGGQVVWFELALEELSGEVHPGVRYRAPSAYPGSWQDFSLVWDVSRGFAALDRQLGQFTHPLLQRREFLYAYQGKGLPKGKASYSFRFWIGSYDHTLASDEIEAFRQSLLTFFEQESIPLRGDG